MKTSINLGALTLLAALGSAPAHGAAPFPDNGNVAVNLSVGGTVQLKCSFIYTPSTVGSGLDLFAGAPNGIRIGTVSEWCNNRTGFKVTIHSKNGGLILAQDPVGAPLLYEMGYGAVFRPSNTLLEVVRAEPAFGTEVGVMMKFDAMTRVVSGAYADVLNIVVTAN